MNYAGCKLNSAHVCHNAVTKAWCQKNHLPKPEVFPITKAAHAQVSCCFCSFFSLLEMNS